MAGFLFIIVIYIRVKFLLELNGLLFNALKRFQKPISYDFFK